MPKAYVRRRLFRLPRQYSQLMVSIINLTTEAALVLNELVIPTARKREYVVERSSAIYDLEYISRVTIDEKRNCYVVNVTDDQ